MKLDMNNVYAQADVHEDAEFDVIADWGKWTTDENSESGSTITYEFAQNAAEIAFMKTACKTINEQKKLSGIAAQIIEAKDMVCMVVIGTNKPGTSKQEIKKENLQKLLVETIVHPPEKRRPGKQKLEDAKPT